jgi:hypothetical protein
VHQGTKTAARGIAAPVPHVASAPKLPPREPTTPKRLAGSLSARAQPF